MATDTCALNGCKLTKEEAADPYLVDGEPYCVECEESWREENESPCPFCYGYFLLVSSARIPVLPPAAYRSRGLLQWCDRAHRVILAARQDRDQLSVCVRLQAVHGRGGPVLESDCSAVG